MHRIIDVAVIGATGGAVDFEWQTPGESGRARARRHHRAHRHRQRHAGRRAAVRATSRANCASGSTGRVFVAHNVRFDYGFIRREFARMETQWRSPILCTVRLSRALYPEMPRHNLDAVMERHGITIETPPSRHARCAGAAGSSGANCARRGRATNCRPRWIAPSLRATLPAALPPDLADDLPERAGRLSLLRRGRAGRVTLICGQGQQPARTRARSFPRRRAGDRARR